MAGIDEFGGGAACGRGVDGVAIGGVLVGGEEVLYDGIVAPWDVAEFGALLDDVVGGLLEGRLDDEDFCAVVFGVG